MKKKIILFMGFLLVLAKMPNVFGEQYFYKNEGKRDPFVSLISPAGYLIDQDSQDNKTLRLEGIIVDPKGDSIAIINGQMMRVGEKIGEAVISSIEENRVTVVQDNQKVDIELRREG